MGLAREELRGEPWREGIDDAATARGSLTILDPALEPSRDRAGALVEPGPPFPNAASNRPPMVLFQTEDGALELHWDLDGMDLSDARAAFRHGTHTPDVQLRLNRLSGSGDASPVMVGTIVDVGGLTHGVARYTEIGSRGPHQAEIGLASEGGGWVLLARSNRLDATGPLGRIALPRAGADRSAMSPGERRPTWDDTPAPCAKGRAAPDGGIPATIHAPGGRFTVDALATSAGIAPPAEGAESARRDRDFLVFAPLDESNAPAGSLPTEAGEASVRASRLGGSGPIRHRPAGESGLHAELLVQGHAAPGSLLDLGGHGYRVGPGGRFELRIPIADEPLIRSLLASLPNLPVTDRD